MKKRIISVLMTMIMLTTVVLPVLSYAATATITVKSGSTVLSKSSDNELKAGDKIVITAPTNVQYIKYQIGTQDVVTKYSNTAEITVPSNLSSFSLNVYARISTTETIGWDCYDIKVAASSSEVPVITVKSGSTTFANNGTYTLNAGDKVEISVSGNVDYMKYKVGEGEVKTVNSSSVTLTVPSNLSEYSLQVFARTKEGVASGTEYNYYNIKVNQGTTNTVPVITVKSGSTTFANNGIYTLNAGDKIEISVSGNVDYMKYKVGEGEVKTVNSSSVTLTVPENFVEYSLQVFARTTDGIASGDEYNYYTIKVNDDVEAPVITVKSGSTTFADNGTYTLNAGDKIVISAKPNIEYIKYKVGTGDIVTVNDSKVELTVPSNLSEYSLQVFTRGEGGTTGWNFYNIVVDQETEAPTITTKSGSTTFKNNGTYELEVGDKITIKAEPDVEYIKYKIGEGEVKTVYGSSVTLTVPDDFAKYSLQVFARGEGGTAGWYFYNIVVDDVNNNDYPMVIQPDEKLNSDVEGVKISLRTIPLTEKDGNQNYFELDEKIQYNIDFVNAGKAINSKVYIDFIIPSNVTAKFVDLNGGKLINDYTVRWTFDGLSKGEKGTIPVVLRYTDMDGDSQVVKPYAKIEASSNEDMSAVINFIFVDSSTKIETSHKPFMIGDAGTYTFRPYEGLNRAEMAMILTRIFNIPLVEDYTVTYEDADVIAQGKYRWAEQAIMTVTKYGLMEGYDDGEFKPEAKVTYAQLITVLARELEIENAVSGLNPFEIKDEPIKLFKDLSKVYSNYGYTDHWAAKYLAQMVRLNMLPDFSDTYDGDVDEVIQRADVAKLISLVLLRGPAEDGTYNDSLTNDFIDVTTRTKNYKFIVEASADEHNSKFNDDGIETMYK